MIRPEKQKNALAALNAVLVAARKLAYDQRPHEQLAQVLDIAEYLPRLMADDRDQTEAFRSNLATLTELDPGFNFAVERFDKNDLGQW